MTTDQATGTGGGSIGRALDEDQEFCGGCCTTAGIAALLQTFVGFCGGGEGTTDTTLLICEEF